MFFVASITSSIDMPMGERAFSIFVGSVSCFQWQTATENRDKVG